MSPYAPAQRVDLQEVLDVDYRDWLDVDGARGDAGVEHREQGLGTAAGGLHLLLPDLAQRTLTLGRPLQEVQQVEQVLH